MDYLTINRNLWDKKTDIHYNSLFYDVDALIKSGLMLTDLQEYNYSPYDCLQNTVEVEPGKFQVRGLENKLPMLYSIVALKM